MLFRNAFKTGGAFSSTIRTRMAANANNKFKATRGMSTVEEATEGGGTLLAAMGATFVTYMTADFLSNFIQHPTQKVRICVSAGRGEQRPPSGFASCIHPRTDFFDL